jgi:catechol 2,3-dioxygenase
MTVAAQDMVVPVGLDHIVIHVRDIAESHAFWTEVIGLRYVADFRRPGRGPMRFYSGLRPGAPHHHDVALVEVAALPGNQAAVSAIGHLAFRLQDRDSWLRQITTLRDNHTAFKCVEHGPSYSVYFNDPNAYMIEMLYERPREDWEHDIDAALNHYVTLGEGDERLKTS